MHSAVAGTRRFAWNKGKPNPAFRGSGNPRWKGGRKIHAVGYILIASPNHPYKDKQGYVREHRLVMEKHIGRHLLPEEDVHHIDGDKQNNSIENLELFPSRRAHLVTRHRDGGKRTWFKKGQAPHNKNRHDRPCVGCGAMFETNVNSEKKYCERTCYWNTKKGKDIPWLNKSAITN